MISLFVIASEYLGAEVIKTSLIHVLCIYGMLSNWGCVGNSINIKREMVGVNGSLIHL